MKPLSHDVDACDDAEAEGKNDTHNFGEVLDFTFNVNEVVGFNGVDSVIEVADLGNQPIDFTIGVALKDLI